MGGFFKRLGGALFGQRSTPVSDPKQQFGFFNSALRGTFEDVFKRAGNLGTIPEFAQANALAAGLPGELKGGAITSTTGAQIAAVNAARLAGGGGRGLALGGAARELASRAATTAAVQQQSALTNALLQGRQLQIGTLLQTGSPQFQLQGNLLAQYLSNAGQLTSTALGGGLSQQKGQKRGLFPLLINGAAKAAGSAIKPG